MAAIICTVTTAEIALAAATAKTVLQLIAPANQRGKILAWGIYFDGISSSAEPVQVVLMRQTTAIGGSPTAVTPSKILKLGAETLQFTATASAGGAEPTSSDVLKRVEVHPQSGYEFVYPLGQEDIVEGAGRIGIVCTAPAVVNAVAWLRFEE